VDTFGFQWHSLRDRGSLRDSTSFSFSWHWLLPASGHSGLAALALICGPFGFRCRVSDRAFSDGLEIRRNAIFEENPGIFQIKDNCRKFAFAFRILIKRVRPTCPKSDNFKMENHGVFFVCA
jgi:hypothetical protein